ncbi:Phosphoglycolate phosphatase [bacterium HR29]|nr:Phosphoglycolate phosphatase [bacterium HR29]
MIRGLLFDWAGTLVRRARAASDPFRACAPWLADLAGRPLQPGDIERAYLAVLDGIEREGRAPDVHRLAAEILDWLGIPAAAGDVEAFALRFFESAAACEELYDDARALLPSLRYRGFLVGVAANSLFRAELLRRQIQRLGIGGYLQAVVTSADLGIPLPNPAVYRAALRCLGIEPYEALYVGASLSLAKGARAAGLRAVLLVRDRRAGDHAGFLAVERLAAVSDLLGSGPVDVRRHRPLL